MDGKSFIVFTFVKQNKEIYSFNTPFTSIKLQTIFKHNKVYGRYN